MKLGYVGRAFVAALVAYALLWVARWLFDWTPFGASLGNVALIAGSLVLARDVVDGLETLEGEVKWLRTQSDRIRVEANREAIEWLRTQEGDRFDPSQMAAYLEGWNKALHELTKTPAPPIPEVDYLKAEK